MSLPNSDITQTFVGGIVVLCEITSNNTILRYSPHHDEDGDDLIFDGNTYTKLPLTMYGLRVSSTGTLPQPVLKCSNVNRELMTHVIDNSNMIGESVTFFCTLDKYLGNGNSDKKFNVSRYQIMQVTSRSRTEITFQLGHPLSFSSMSIPSRLILREAANPDHSFPSVGKFKI